MGCWCETDGITQLPIVHRDDIRFFVLLNRGYSYGAGKISCDGGGICYINDIWNPLGMVKGKYNDYGMVEDIVPTTGSELLLKYFKKEDDCVDLEKMLRRIERSEIDKYGIMIVLEEVYQALVQFNPIIYDHRGKPSLYKPIREYFRVAFDRWWKEFYEKFGRTDVSKVDSMVVTFNCPEVFHHEFGRDDLTELYRKFFIQRMEEQSDEGVAEAANDLIEFRLFENAMNYARKQWIPQCGKGSQQDETAVYRVINKVVGEICDAKEKELIEDGCDVPDENGYTPYELEHNAKALGKESS